MKEWILVTGGCGSIGERLIRAVLDGGKYGVLNIDRALGPRSDSQDYEFVHGDIREVEFDNLLTTRKISCLVHLAAESDERGSFERVLDFHETNVSGTLRVLEASRHHNIPHAILLSSIAVKAADGGLIKTPRSPYAATKLAGEMFAEVHARLHEMHISVLRICDLYGNGVEGSELQDLLDQLSDQDAVRICKEKSFYNPVHVDDVVNGIMASIESGKGFNLHELGDPNSISDEEVIQLVSSIMNKNFEVQRVTEMPALNGEAPDPTTFLRSGGMSEFRDIRSGLAHALDG